MATKTRKIAKSEMKPSEREAIVEKSKQVVSSLEKNLTIYQSDLERNAQTLCDTFKVTTVEEALVKVEELNKKLPGLQAERDQLVVEIQEYLTKNNL